MLKALSAIAALLGFSGAAHAALPVGSKAPAFATSGAEAGKPFRFNLATG